MSDPLLSTCTGRRGFERPAENNSPADPRLRTHSNVARWDLEGFAVEQLRREGLNNTQIARLLCLSPRAIKRRLSRVSA